MSAQHGTCLKTGTTFLLMLVMDYIQNFNCPLWHQSRRLGYQIPERQIYQHSLTYNCGWSPTLECQTSVSTGIPCVELFLDILLGAHHCSVQLDPADDGIRLLVVSPLQEEKLLSRHMQVCQGFRILWTSIKLKLTYIPWRQNYWKIISFLNGKRFTYK
jgi:hypothetical protein